MYSGTANAITIAILSTDHTYGKKFIHRFQKIQTVASLLLKNLLTFYNVLHDVHTSKIGRYTCLFFNPQSIDWVTEESRPLQWRLFLWFRVCGFLWPLGPVPDHCWWVQLVALSLAAALGALRPLVQFLGLGPVGRPWLAVEQSHT